MKSIWFTFEEVSKAYASSVGAENVTRSFTTELNLILAHKISQEPTVTSPMHLENPSWTPKRHPKDTHGAKLICIQELAK